MSRNKTIDYVEFHANDLPAIKQFYTQVFGWAFEYYGPEYTSFKMEGYPVALAWGPYLRGRTAGRALRGRSGIYPAADQRCRGTNY